MRKKKQKNKQLIPPDMEPSGFKTQVVQIIIIYRKFPNNSLVPINRRVSSKHRMHECMLINNRRFQIIAGSIFFLTNEEEITTRPSFLLHLFHSVALFFLQRQREIEDGCGCRAAKNLKVQGEF